MPVAALEDELLIVNYDDEEGDEQEGHEDAKASTDSIVQQIEKGFEELEAENAIEEDLEIAVEQQEQEKKIDEIIHEANEEAKRVIDEAVHTDGQLVVEDIAEVYEHRTEEINEANKEHDEEVAAISKEHAVKDVFNEAAK